jgi:outer membrane protein assembly factor BamA
MSKVKERQYTMLSPDGFTIEFGVNHYSSREKMEESFEKFKERYRRQGYYSSNEYGRIPLEDLWDYCLISSISLN